MEVEWNKKWIAEVMVCNPEEKYTDLLLHIYVLLIERAPKNKTRQKHP